MRAALLLTLLASACATQEVPSMDKTALFDFTDATVVRAWRSVDDDVMGGVSSSRIEPGVDSVPRGARFVGTVSLENNGGFASIRSKPALLGLAGAEGLELELIGDGHTYKLSIRLDSDLDGISYQANLTPLAGSVSRTRIAFVDLVPMWRGRRVPDAPPFDPARAAQVGLVIGDKQAGAFELGLVAIRVLYP